MLIEDEEDEEEERRKEKEEVIESSHSSPGLDFNWVVVAHLLS